MTEKLAQPVPAVRPGENMKARIRSLYPGIESPLATTAVIDPIRVFTHESGDSPPLSIRSQLANFLKERAAQNGVMIGETVYSIVPDSWNRSTRDTEYLFVRTGKKIIGKS
jgi:hypothetical protein